MAELQYGERGAKSAYPVRIFADNPRRVQELSLLARECGAKIAGEGGLPSPQLPPENSAAHECLLIDFPSISERQSSEMDNLSSYISSSSTDALVWADMETLDDAFALLPQDKCQFLIEPSDVEAVLLLTGAITRGNMNQFHSNSRDEGYEELHKISSELADVVRTLT